MKVALARWFLWASVWFSGTLFGGALNEQLARLAMVLTTFVASAAALSTAD